MRVPVATSNHWNKGWPAKLIMVTICTCPNLFLFVLITLEFCKMLMAAKHFMNLIYLFEHDSHLS